MDWINVQSVPSKREKVTIENLQLVDGTIIEGLDKNSSYEYLGVEDYCHKPAVNTGGDIWVWSNRLASIWTGQ